MENMVQTESGKSNRGYILLLSSLLVTGFLFFIDEGNYNFQWIKNPGSWFVFMIYALSLFVFQQILSEFIPWKSLNKYRLVISIIAGSVLGILFVTTIVF